MYLYMVQTVRKLLWLSVYYYGTNFGFKWNHFQKKKCVDTSDKFANGKNHINKNILEKRNNYKTVPTVT